MNRETFLKSVWAPYPPMPEASYQHGRLLSLDENRRALLWRDDQSHEITLRDWAVPGPPGASASLADILQPGDLIAVTAAGEVTLLAPWTTTGLFKPLSKKTLRNWSRFLFQVRVFFEREGFLEVGTPGLVPCPGTEPSLDVFSTELVVGSNRRTLFLPTSPELHLKKALGRGLDEIFEIKSCYRNGEITSHHQPEFTMIEWYRAWSGPGAIRNDVVRLIQDLAEKMNDTEARSPQNIRLASMAELFKEKFGVELTPEWTLEDYRRLAEQSGLEIRPGATIDDLFFLLFTEKIERAFDPEEVTIVDRWPPFQAALARLTLEGWADRFEVYWQGLELANAFHELNDPQLQRRRFKEDLQKKAALGKTPIALDDDFLKAMDRGLPPSAGIALGLERLFMALFGVDDIASLKAFPYR